MASTAAQTISKLFSLSISSPKPLSLSSPITASLLSSSPSSSLRLRRRRRRFPTSLPFSTTTPLKVSATIAVNSPLPDATLSYLPPTSDDLQTLSVSDLTKSKKTILFAVPGAFTPTCSLKHLPSFVEKAAELKAKGVDTIACISVNDAFVMRAWKKELGVGDEVLMLSDGNGDFTRAIGCEMDLSDKPIGLGVRSRRYAMLVEDGVVKVLNLEEGGAFTFSGAEDMLKAL